MLGQPGELRDLIWKGKEERWGGKERQKEREDAE